MNDYKNNRNKLIKDMKKGELALFFAGNAPASSADSLYPFRTDKNFFYMTGLKREGFILLIMKGVKENKEVLFINEPNYDIEKWVGRALTKEQCTDLSAIDEVLYLDGFEAYMNRLIYGATYKSVYLDLARAHKDREGLEAHVYAKKVQDKYPELRIKNVHGFMSHYRCFKSDSEIRTIKKAISLTQKGLERVMTTLKPGDYEYRPKVEFDYSIMKHGADGNAFETIAASGVNATILHYIENNMVMADNTLVLMDLGAQYGEYASDITRTYPVNGRFTQRQKDVYNLVLKAHDAVIDLMAPGVAFEELNKKSSEILMAGLKELGLIKEADELGKYYYHGVSHYMGLDTHDLGERDTKLKPGMVLTVEPGLYISEEAIGIRIEDDILITEHGCEVLSADIIRTVEDIEAFMAKA